MKESSLFDNLTDLQEKFNCFLVHRKKIKSLENYSQVSDFQHVDYLNLIKKCMDDGFLGVKEAEFLTYMINQYSINFLDWSHKTPWLKKEMRRLADNYQPTPPRQLDLFDYRQLKPNTPANVSFDLLAQSVKVNQSSCRA